MHNRKRLNCLKTHGHNDCLHMLHKKHDGTEIHPPYLNIKFILYAGIYPYNIFIHEAFNNALVLYSMFHCKCNMNLISKHVFVLKCHKPRFIKCYAFI